MKDKVTLRIILIFCLIKLALHLIADSHTGFQGDEPLHISAGNHLAWGYMEFPPMIGLIAFVQNLFHSDSIFVHHIFPHLATLVIMVTIGLTTKAAGGGPRAVFLALLAYVIAPASGGSNLQPVVFSQLFWVLSFYQLFKFVQSSDRKHLWYLTLFVTLGFLTKYDMLFFMTGLVALLTSKHTRQALVSNRWWQCVLVFLVVVTPNIIWQSQHEWPVYQMFHRLYETQLDHQGKGDILKGIMLASNPVSLLLLVPGIIWLFFRKPGRIYRTVGIAIVVSFLVLLKANGKNYYFFSIIFTILPFGAVWVEEKLIGWQQWLLWPVTAILLTGAVLIPFGFPLLTLDNYLQHYYKYQQKDIPGGKYAVPYEEYYTQEMWPHVLGEMRAVYDSLPAAEKKDCMVWGKHYNQTGIFELMGKQYGLPKEFGYHGSFYSWAPASGAMPQTVVALAFNDTPDYFFTPFYEEVIPVRVIPNIYAGVEGRVNQTIYICKKPKYNFAEMKEQFRKRIFE
ncbi:glycosyltransferase family 39 protein [Chitinophaga sp. Cy-1792]|uniref:ArnT family glycosyltransferase n=1 Tax=Chitinophaga sp. Cy-1792 TaxID=2608339 RepID=UPI00142477EC|nr:glycosyltransferase family 39 protein [Chitinophaga sp. Cy-1792]NIG55135.1 glycosyltransferase family 39 protein [Chitinophaga sp. Cy-1792]